MTNASSFHAGFCKHLGSKALVSIFITFISAQSLLAFVLLFRLSTISVVPNDASDAADAACQHFQAIHTVFSTGCSSFQQWQAYIFFYHAMLVGQPGDITRIVSGCTEEKQELYARQHREEITAKMSNRFHIHFTPDYTNILEGRFPEYLNKPYGLRHWMTNVLGYPSKQDKKLDNTIIALLDPDMILTRPLINNFAGFRKYNAGNQTGLAERCVTHGQPIAQLYAYGNEWLEPVRSHLSDIVGNHSPVYNVTNADAMQLYPAGPPYLLTMRDMYQVVEKWCEFTPTINHFNPVLLAEMFGYSMASAHLQLRHQLGYSLMASDPHNKVEVWRFLDGVEPGKVCEPGHVKDIPMVLHYCQRYSVGRNFVSKYVIARDFLSCASPLLPKPPKALALQSKSFLYFNGTMMKFKDADEAARVAFAFCLLTEKLNQAATYFKQNHCQGNAIWNATYSPYPVAVKTA